MVAVTFDSVKELLAKTEQERRDELVHNDVKLKELQAICHVLGLPEKGLKAELVDRISMCHGVIETETRDDRYRSPHVQSRVATNLRAAAFQEVPVMPGSQVDHSVKEGEGGGSSSAAASGSSSAQDQQHQQASAAHDHQHLSRAAAASLAPGFAPAPAPPPANTHHNTIPPPVSFAPMSVDNTHQQPAPVVPAASQPPSFSPVATRYKEKFRLFVERERAPLPPLAEVPTLPVGDQSDAFQSLANGVNTLIAGVNEIRSELKDNVKLKDLQEFREMQSDEFKEMITVHTEPLRVAVDDHTCRLEAIETRMDRVECSSGMGEAERKRLLDDSDPAFKQIAISGFKMNDLKRRVRLLEQFVSTNFSDIKVANIESIHNGPWKNRKPTGVVVIEFFSRDARDQALTIAKDLKVKDENGVAIPDLKIDRARTRAQRARNWALRKAEELAKVEASKLGIPGAGRIDFTMPVRKVFVGNVLAFQQKRDELRGEFVSAFSKLVLPP